MESSILYVIIFSLIGGVVSLCGGLLLLAKKRSANVLVRYATPFAAGALLSAAFLDVLPEGAELSGARGVLIWALAGLLIFFVLESWLSWFHHHHEHDKKDRNPTGWLIIIGDTLHNAIDGIAIAAAFLISPAVGIVTTLAVAAHEIPQEIGDFALLLKKGYSRRQVLIVNAASALVTTLTAVLFYYFGADQPELQSAMLGLTGGFFVYIAVSDIIPGIHTLGKKDEIRLQSLILILGVAVMAVVTTYAHGVIEDSGGHSHDHGAETILELHEYHEEHGESHEEEGHEEHNE